MNELMNNQLINASATETIDSREVAEMVDMEHKNLLSKIRKYIEILDGSKLSSHQFFVPSTYVNNQNKEQPCYLLTKKGCEMVANKLTGEKGVIFTAKYVNRFEEMEKQIKIPKTDREILFLSVKVQEETAQRVDVLEEKVSSLEKSTTIDSSQQQILEKIAKATVIRTLGGFDSRAYQLMSRKIFSNIWRDYKNYFKLGSFRDTLKTEFENAKEYLESWSPEVNTSLKIKEYNSQLAMNLDA
ncbi:phage regulatory protein [Coprobacillus sp. AF16-47]|uniref:Rha family transcriptional regulator n=1 Tax=Faecalibacillus intestinalis TaxID=1982626 RepID=UPI000E51580A|nr:Rha family transcriptional regulator [Faecalibacillus intestinalis]RGG96379.1 phage regulatory protein [Coprobacillus sp. AF16-47]